MKGERPGRLTAGLILGLTMLLGGCFEQELQISVLPDGSGTITVRSVVARARLGPQEIAEFSEAEEEFVEPLRTAGERFGPVELVGIERIDDGSHLGHVATYRFEDVNKVLLRYPEQEGLSDTSIFRFRFTPGLPARLEITSPPTDDGPDMSESPEMMAAFLGQMAGWRRHYAVRFPGTLAGSDVVHVAEDGDATVVTLMELDVDALLGDPEGMELLSETGMDFQMMARLGVPGVRGQDPDRPTVLDIRFADEAAALAAAEAMPTDVVPSGEASPANRAVSCDRRSGQPATIGSHEGPVTAATFSRDCEFVATGSLDGTAAVWSYATGEEITRVAVAEERRVMTVAFSPDGSRLLTAGALASRRDRMPIVQMWEVASGEELWRFPGPGFEPGEMTDEGWSEVWGQWFGRTCNRAGSSGNNPLSSKSRVAVVLSPDGERVLAASYDGTIRLLDAADGASLMDFDVPRHVALTASFSPEGGTVAIGGADGSVQLWSTETGKPVRQYEPHLAAVAAIAFSPDGERLLTASEDHTARVLSAGDGSVLRQIGELCPEWGESAEWSGLGYYMGAPATNAMFSDNGRKILIARDSAHVELWPGDSDDGVLLFELGFDDFSRLKPVTALAVSPDGETLLSGATDALTAKLTSVDEGDPWD